MNKTYKVIFSKVRGALMVCQSKRKASGSLWQQRDLLQWQELLRLMF